MAMGQFIENADIVLFVSRAELKDALGFFTNAKHEKANVAKSLAMQSIPFPRMHFFMLGTAMGQSLKAKDIMVPSLSVGSAAAIDSAQYMSANKGKAAAYFLSDSEYKPVNNRSLPGKDGFGVTVCMPGATLVEAFEALLDPLRHEACNYVVLNQRKLTWANVLGPDVNDPTDLENEDCPWKNAQVEEAASNLEDLIAEMDQYSCGIIERSHFVVDDPNEY